MKCHTETLGEAFIVIGKLLDIAMPNITDVYYEESKTIERRFIHADVGDVRLQFDNSKPEPWEMVFRFK